MSGLRVVRKDNKGPGQWVSGNELNSHEIKVHD